MLIWWVVFRPDGTFLTVTDVAPKAGIEQPYRPRDFSMLQEEGTIDVVVIERMLAWHNTGFGMHVGLEIAATDAVGRENVARYLCHPPVVIGRIVAQDSVSRVVHKSDTIHPRHGANFRVFDPLDFIAEIVAHIPDTYEKTAMAYGWYSNRTRGYRKKHGLLSPGAPVRCEEADSDKGPLEARRAWARLIAKVYEVNPLVCPRCGSEMKVVAVIDQEDAIYKILRHLGLLAPEESRAPPATGPPAASASPPPPGV